MATTKIRSSSITDGQVSNADLSATVAVTGGQIADDAITTAKILDDNVTTAKILDNNVTLAKMADGTQGDTLYYGASGAPTLLAKPGTPADEVLTFATGATAPSWVAPASGGLIKYTVYTGNATWNKSTNSPTKVVVEVQGGGGGGGGSFNGTSWCGGTGGSGGFCQKFIDVSSISTSTIVVGVAGSAGAHVGAGGAGGNSSWSDGTNTLTGTGGGGGASAIYPTGGHGAGGSGGGASGGDLNVAGPNGSTNVAGPKNSPGSMWGLFNPVTTQGASSGLAGTGYGAPGGGGTGGGVQTGGAGSAGVVIVWEYA